MNPQLDLFSLPTYQNELFGAEFISVRPFNAIGNGPIDFFVKDSKEYIDLNETVLAVKVRVVNADGTAIAAATDGKDNVAIVNNAMHSIWSDIQVYLNQKRIEGGDCFMDLNHTLAQSLDFLKRRKSSNSLLLVSLRMTTRQWMLFQMQHF